ncbi:hypothetical protein GF412_04070 [Candidatus Micrarchaeota archaeon]|nr:hypothetical protein [Candidatus Micrarchaeota archaeon]MBD3418126.1 hypothetical protein [Candidatus Micrarchaeota archaeon]
MPPPKERVLARISSEGSAPAVEVLPKKRSKESGMRSFGTVRPIIEHAKRGHIRCPSPRPAETDSGDSISPALLVRGMGRSAYRLFTIMRALQREEEEFPFRADSTGLFWGEKRVGQVMRSSGECPLIRVWLDWVYSSPKKRLRNLNLISGFPLPAAVRLFDVGTINTFFSRFSSTNYAAVSADTKGVRLGLYDKKKGPELYSFAARLL